MAIPTTSVISSAQLAATGAVSTASCGRQVCCKTRRQGGRFENLVAFLVFGQHLLYKAEEHEICIFRKTLLEFDFVDFLSHLHVRFDNAVGRFKMQKLCRSHNCNTYEANSKAREWTAVTQGRCFYMARTKFRTSKVIMNINNIVKTVSSNSSCHPFRVSGL